MSVEIREIVAARLKEEIEIREVYRWLEGERTEPLPSELKSRFVDMAAQQFGEHAAAAAMDQVANKPMPKVMQ